MRVAPLRDFVGLRALYLYVAGKTDKTYRIDYFSLQSSRYHSRLIQDYSRDANKKLARVQYWSYRYNDAVLAF